VRRIGAFKGAAVVVLGFCATSAWGLQARPDRPVVALFPPWWGQSQVAAAVSRASGAIMRNSLWPSLIVAGGRGPSFLSALRRQHAWLLLDAAAAAGCAASMQGGNMQ
jgi:hypothetical protein